MKRGAIVCPVLVVLLLVSVFHMTELQLPNCKGAGSDQTIDGMQPRTIEHRITGSELQLLKSRIGVEEESENYSQIVYGHGTGLAPPSEADWEKIGKEAYVVEQVTFPISLPSNVDNSVTPWFPPIGNQGSQGSCVAWAVGYYVKTFQEAKEHNWSPSGAIPDEIMSPSFIYNLINNGVNQATSYFDAIQLVCSVGDCSLAKMPYNAADCTSWPSEKAWKEAPYYRGASTGFEYMYVDTDGGIQSLKNWIASENLAVIGVDANQYSSLTSNDVWTLDNYAGGSNHANTIVGYDDNFTYWEGGQLSKGAFKIANSWGVGGWERVPDGFYWISYKAMSQKVGYVMFYGDRIGYVPTLTCSFEIEHPMRGECSIVIGMGKHDYPTVSKSFTDYIHGGNQPFCSNNIVFDITEFEDAVPNVYDKPFFLSVYDGGSPATGTILYFSVGNNVSSNPPVTTVNGGYVFADLTLIDEPHNADAMWIEPSAVNFNVGTTSVGFKFNVTVAMNFTENVFVWQAVLYYNATQLNCTRVGATAGATSDFMTGHTTTFVKAINPGSYPPVNGSLQSVVAAESCFGPDFIPGPHSGTLFWAEFQILLAPGAGQTFNSKFDISTQYALSSVYVWDSTGTPLTFTPYDGTYQFSCALSLVVRGEDNGIYYRVFKSASTWDAWNSLPGTTCDSPAAAVYQNQLHIVVRGMDGNSLWHGWVDLTTHIFTGWNLLSGATSSAPTLTSNGTALALTVRGGDNRVYYRFYTIASQTWTDWSVLPSGTTLDSPTASLVGNELHIVVRGTDGSTLWYSNVNQTTGVFSGWTLLSGSTPSTPTLSLNSATLGLVVRGGDNRIYYRFYTIAAHAWTGWTALPSGTTMDSPAATIVRNTLYIVVRGSGGNSLWQSSINLGTSTFSGWTLLSGSTPSKPTLTS